MAREGNGGVQVWLRLEGRGGQRSIVKVRSPMYRHDNDKRQKDVVKVKRLDGSISNCKQQNSIILVIMFMSNASEEALSLNNRISICKTGNDKRNRAGALYLLALYIGKCG